MRFVLFILLAVSSVGAAWLEAPAQKKELVFLHIKQESPQKLYWIERRDEKVGVVHRFPTSSATATGRAKDANGKWVRAHTATGVFKVQRTARNHASRLFGVDMPYSVFFSPSLAIHASNQTAQLGSPASGGCLRLATKHAKRVYERTRQFRAGGHDAYVIVLECESDIGKLDQRWQRLLASAGWTVEEGKDGPVQ